METIIREIGVKSVLTKSNLPVSDYGGTGCDPGIPQVQYHGERGEGCCLTSRSGKKIRICI